MDAGKYEKIFRQESERYLQELDELLAKAEKSPESTDLWAEIHGKLHSIKGMAKALNLHRIIDLSHSMEGWCKSFQEVRETPTLRAVETILKGAELLRRLVSNRDGIESAAEQAQVEGAMALLEKGPGAFTERETEGLRIPASSVSGPKEIETVRVRYSLIEELLGLSREIMMERSAPSLSPGRFTGGLKAWTDEYRAMVKRLYLRLAKLRLMSIGDFVDLFGKTVRDMARQNGKEVRLEVWGEEIAADVTLLERLREPLLHLLRNAIAHGIESPDARRRAGKDPEGRIILEARREKKNLYLVMKDDGRGINRDAIRDYLLRKAHMSQEAISSMHEQELLRTILHPEFSSVARTTDLAGRGIGMNVVVQALDYLGGLLMIQSEPEKGTTFTMKLPVLLSVMNGLVFRVGRYSLSIPALDVHSVSRTDGREGEGSRLIDLRHLMGMGDDGNLVSHMVRVRSRDWGGTDNGMERETGLLVDHVVGNKTMMVLPVGDLLGKAKIYAGAGILENGDLTILLDVASLVAEGDGTMRDHHSGKNRHTGYR